MRYLPLIGFTIGAILTSSAQAQIFIEPAPIIDGSTAGHSTKETLTYVVPRAECIARVSFQAGCGNWGCVGGTEDVGYSVSVYQRGAFLFGYGGGGEGYNVDEASAAFIGDLRESCREQSAIWEVPIGAPLPELASTMCTRFIVQYGSFAGEESVPGFTPEGTVVPCF